MWYGAGAGSKIPPWPDCTVSDGANDMAGPNISGIRAGFLWPDLKMCDGIRQDKNVDVNEQ